MKFRNRIVLLGALTMLMAPEMAFAAYPGEATLQQIVNFLTGNPARLCGLIACCAVGWSAWTGRMDWDKARNFVVGCIFVFGSAAIMDLASRG